MMSNTKKMQHKAVSIKEAAAAGGQAATAASNTVRAAVAASSTADAAVTGRAAWVAGWQLPAVRRALPPPQQPLPAEPAPP